MLKVCKTDCLRWRRSLSIGLFLAAPLLSTGSVRADSVTLSANRDNTLFENATGSISNGVGDSFVAGRVGATGGGAIRRGVVYFDVAAAIPSGSVITRVTLTLRNVTDNNGNQAITLHRLLADWGEGTSTSTGGAGAPATTGDATWLHRFWPDTFWSTVGGDFVAGAGASQTVGLIGDYSWGPAAGLTADAQGWLDDPASNFGWLVKGNELVQQTTKRLASREWLVAAERPRLTIEFDPPAPIVGDLNGDQIVDGVDLGILLASWSIPPRSPGCRGALPCAADLNGDGVVDGLDLGILLVNWTV